MLLVMKYLFVLLAVAGTGTAAADVNYVVDAGNSSVAFSVRHLVINKVRGAFSSFRGALTVDPDTGHVRAISGEIDTASLTTNNEDRDAHLRSPDFFDVEAHPMITFESTGIRFENNGTVATGVLSMNGTSKVVEVPFEVIGSVKDPWGNTRLGIEAAFTVNRHDFGISWSQTLDGGGLVVGDDVHIELNVEAVKR